MIVRHGEQAGLPSRDPASVLKTYVNHARPGGGVKACSQDIQSFAAFCGCGQDEAAERLFGARATRDSAVELVERYRAHLESTGKAVGTIKRRIGAIRGLVRYARLVGAITWDIRVSVPNASRDSRKLSPEVRAHAEELAALAHVRARRDYALLTCIQEASLSREEISALTLEHYEPNPASPLLRVLRNASIVTVPVSQKLKAAMDSWVEVRGLRAGPLFTRILDDRPVLEHGLEPDDVLAIIRPDPSRDLG